MAKTIQRNLGRKPRTNITPVTVDSHTEAEMWEPADAPTERSTHQTEPVSFSLGEVHGDTLRSMAMEV